MTQKQTAEVAEAKSIGKRAALATKTAVKKDAADMSEFYPHGTPQHRTDVAPVVAKRSHHKKVVVAPVAEVVAPVVVAAPVPAPAKRKYTKRAVVAAPVVAVVADPVPAVAPVVVVPIAPAPVSVPVAPAPLVHVDVRQRAMLVKLEIHKWPARTVDTVITDEVAEHRGIEGEMGKYRKELLPKEALAKIRTAARALRARHNALTLPWDENSTRILSSAAWTKYNATVRAGVDEFEQIFQDELAAIGESGVSKYEEQKREAKRLLNGAYREADYPTLEQIRRKFRASISVFPIPDGADFRIELGADETAQVRNEIEARVNEKIESAMRDLYERVKFVVERLSVTLKSEASEEIRATLLTSITAVLDVLPLLNVTGDTMLDTLAVEIREMISGVDAKALRESPSFRDVIAQRADAILAQMNDFLN
jgi:hypothetical protein